MSLQELAEARDALLQEVELSHQHQEQLQEELRYMDSEGSPDVDSDVFEPENDNSSGEVCIQYTIT